MYLLRFAKLRAQLSLLGAGDFGLIAQVEAHSAMITSLHAFSKSALVTGGLDSYVRAWKIDHLDSKKRSAPVALSCLWTIDQKSKVNAVRSTGLENQVFVCDTSPVISFYTLPC